MTYDKLRLLHFGLCETLSPPVYQEVHTGKQVKFGPLRLDSEPPASLLQQSDKIKYTPNINFKRHSFVDQELSSGDEEISKGRVMSPNLNSNRLLHTSLSRVTEQSRNSNR
jgi:hypothetical protein